MNKLKGSSNAVRMKHLIMIFAVSLLVALPLRTYQLLVLVNPENGFFENGDFTVPLLYGAVAGFVVLFLVLSFISKSIPAPKLATGKNPLLGIASLLMTGGFIWDIIAIERKIVPQISSYTSVDIFRNLFSVYLKENGGMFLILELIFAILGAFYFLVFAVSQFEGKPHYKRFPVIALAPLCWSITVLISKLMKAISFITVSELLFEIFMFVFAMLFFLTFARICSEVFTENSMWGIFGYGFATAFLGALVTIPRLIVLFVGLEPVDGNEFSFTYFVIFIFAVVFILAAIGVGFKHGLKNIRTVSEVELPDDAEVVVKGSDVAYVTEFADDETDYVTDAHETEKTDEVVIEEVFSYGIDDALDDYLEEIDAETVAEEATEEPVIDVVEETTEEPVAEVVEEVTEEPVIEVVEEVTEEPVIDVVEETTEEPVVEVAEEIAAEPVVETVEEVTERIADDAEISEEFVDFSDMLIEDVDDIYDEQESVTEPMKAESEELVAEEVSSAEEKSIRSNKDKKKSEKPGKPKKFLGKNKKQTADEADVEVIKIVSLADLKNKDSD